MNNRVPLCRPVFPSGVEGPWNWRPCAPFHAWWGFAWTGFEAWRPLGDLSQLFFIKLVYLTRLLWGGGQPCIPPCTHWQKGKIETEWNEQMKHVPWPLKFAAGKFLCHRDHLHHGSKIWRAKQHFSEVQILPRHLNAEPTLNPNGWERIEWQTNFCYGYAIFHPQDKLCLKTTIQQICKVTN